MIICSASNIGIAVYDDWLFREISLEIDERDRLAIVGPNGSGKTTLVQILSGVLVPDEGQISWKRDARVGFLRQNQAYDTNWTVLQVLEHPFAHVKDIERRMQSIEVNLATTTEAQQLDRLLTRYATLQDQFDRLGGYHIDSKIRSVAGGIGIPESSFDTLFASLSGGEQTKVSLAALLMTDFAMLVLDEPTNHLDFSAIEWLETYVKNYQGAVVTVSHDRQFLDEVATKVVELDQGSINVYHGNYSSAMVQREERLLAEFQAYEEQQKKIQHMRQAIKRLRDWANRSNPPSAGLHRRATNMQRALDRMEVLDKPIVDRKKISLAFESRERSGQDVIQMLEVSKTFADRAILRNVSMHIRYGEHVALVGVNGSGKSTLLKMTLGEVPIDSGEVKVGASVSFGYLSQNALQGQEHLTVLDAFRNAVAFTEQQARGALAKFLFYGEDVFKKCEFLSGGEQMRLRLAQLIYQDINLLILDEPTNHLDIDSREALEAALEDFPGTVLAVSHDRHFMNRSFSRTLWLEDAEITSYLGAYSEARAKRESIG